MDSEIAKQEHDCKLVRKNKLTIKAKYDKLLTIN